MALSDLHLFSRRSQGVDHLESLRARLSSLDLLVLNGDIFDFRWSTLPSHESTVRAALAWLEELVRGLPNCQVHFLLGNHDCLRLFQEGLAGLVKSLPRFQWHEYFLQLDTALFLHGDCVQRRVDSQGLDQYRERWRQDRRRGKLAAHAYGWIDRLGVTRLGHQWHFPLRDTLERITGYLDRANPGWRKRTRDCYFGHTHLPFANFEHEGILFHNTGSAIRHMRFHPVTFEIRMAS